MADKVTTTSKTASKKAADTTTEDSSAKIEDLKNQLRDALIESGRDAGTVDAQLYALRLPEDSVVGNLADLQRMGALAAKGESGDLVKQAVEMTPEPVPNEEN